MSSLVLSLNAGSSSIKFSLFEAAAEPRRIARGKIDAIGSAAHLSIADAVDKILVDKPVRGTTHEELLGPVLASVDDNLAGGKLVAAVHRIVHGGSQFQKPAVLTPETIAALSALSPLAPLHQPHNLSAVAAIAHHRPQLMQIGCFDTAFHATMGREAKRFALPRALEQQGVRRYGFHGLSYEFIASRLKEIAPDKSNGRIIVAHLGNGASLCAMRNGQSIDTTMGFSTLDGLVMGTRCGALDPGVPLYLMQQGGMDAAGLQDLLYHRSGLLGVSGVSGDMRDLVTSDNRQAEEAIALFVFRAVREIGALAASLGGVDGLVFTAGIGENAPEIRRRIAAGCAWLGLTIDAAANQAGATRIDTQDSRIPAWVIPTDEEFMMAHHAVALLHA